MHLVSWRPSKQPSSFNWTVIGNVKKMGSPVVVAALVAPLASSSSTTTTTTSSIIEGATTRTATNNFAAEVVGMVAVGTTLPWERECAGYPRHMDMNASGHQALSGPLHPHPPPHHHRMRSSKSFAFYMWTW